MDSVANICVRFRTKAMVVRGEQIVRTPESLEFPYCWCTKTLTDLGPDEGLVALPRCLNTQRSCYEPIP